MKHPKTTIGGVFLLVGSLATFVGRWLAVGFPTADEWTMMLMGVNAGVVAIMAADAKK